MKKLLIGGSVEASRVSMGCMRMAGADITLSRQDWYAVYLAAGFRLP